MKGKEEPTGRAPAAPREEAETARRRIAALLESGPLSAKEISAAARIPERAVFEHLRHIERTLHRGNRRVAVSPAECRGCGFLFRKRHRFEKPGRCPLCRGQSIAPPLFSIAAPDS